MSTSYIRYPVVGGGGGGGMVIGDPVTDGHANDILFIDASGNLAQADVFQYSVYGAVHTLTLNNITLSSDGSQRLTVSGFIVVDGIAAPGATADYLTLNYSGGHQLGRLAGDLGWLTDNTHDLGISNDFGGDNLRPRYMAVGTAMGVGVTYNSLPDASSVMDLRSTSKGGLMPRMTTAQKNAIASPAEGLIVYDLTLQKLCVFTTAWETITSI